MLSQDINANLQQKGLGFNADGLKLIAIIAMTIEYIA